MRKVENTQQSKVENETVDERILQRHIVFFSLQQLKVVANILFLGHKKRVAFRQDNDKIFKCERVMSNNGNNNQSRNEVNKKKTHYRCEIISEN